MFLDCETHLTVQVNCIDLNAKDGLGLTPFMKACINGHKEVVKLLFENLYNKTIDLNLRDVHGRTQFINETFSFNVKTPWNPYNP